MDSAKEQAPPERHQAALWLLELHEGQTEHGDKDSSARDPENREASAARSDKDAAASIDIDAPRDSLSLPPLPLEAQDAADIHHGSRPPSAPLPIGGIADYKSEWSSFITEVLKDRSRASPAQAPPEDPNAIAGAGVTSSKCGSRPSQVLPGVDALLAFAEADKVSPAPVTVGGLASSAANAGVQASATVTGSTASGVMAGSAGASSSTTPGATASIRKQYKKRLTTGGDPECPFIGEPVDGRIEHKQVGWVTDPSVFSVPLCGVRRSQRNCPCDNRNCREIRTRRAMFAIRVEKLPLRDAEALWCVARSTVHQRLLAVASKDKMHVYNLLN